MSILIANFYCEFCVKKENTTIVLILVFSYYIVIQTITIYF